MPGWRIAYSLVTTVLIGALAGAFLGALWFGTLIAAVGWGATRYKLLTTEVGLHRDGLKLRVGKSVQDIAFEDVDRLVVHLERDGLIRNFLRALLPSQPRLGSLLERSTSDRFCGLRRTRPPKWVALATHDHRSCVVPLRLAGAGEILEELVRRCSEPLTQDAREALSRGERLTFGDVILDASGVDIAKKHLPWKRIAKVVVGLGYVSFYGPGELRWRHVEMHEVTHPTLLITLLRDLAPRVELAQ